MSFSTAIKNYKKMNKDIDQSFNIMIKELNKKIKTDGELNSIEELNLKDGNSSNVIDSIQKNIISIENNKSTNNIELLDELKNLSKNIKDNKSSNIAVKVTNAIKSGADEIGSSAKNVVTDSTNTFLNQAGVTQSPIFNAFKDLSLKGGSALVEKVTEKFKKDQQTVTEKNNEVIKNNSTQIENNTKQTDDNFSKLIGINNSILTALRMDNLNDNEMLNEQIVRDKLLQKTLNEIQRNTKKTADKKDKGGVLDKLMGAMGLGRLFGAVGIGGAALGGAGLLGSKLKPSKKPQVPIANKQAEKQVGKSIAKSVAKKALLPIAALTSVTDTADMISDVSSGKKVDSLAAMATRNSIDFVGGDSSKFTDAIGGSIAKVLSFFGNENATETLKLREKQKQIKINENKKSIVKNSKPKIIQSTEQKMGDLKIPDSKRKKITPEVENAINTAAEKHDIDPAILFAMADYETGGTFDPKIKARDPRSDATGLFQFTQGTGRAYGLIKGKANRSGDIRSDAMANADAAARLAKDNVKMMVKMGIPEEIAMKPEHIYLAHQQGAGGAANLIKGDISKIPALNASTNLPKKLRGKGAGALYDFHTSKFKKRFSVYDNSRVQEPKPITKTNDVAKLQVQPDKSLTTAKSSVDSIKEMQVLASSKENLSSMKEDKKMMQMSQTFKQNNASTSVKQPMPKSSPSKNSSGGVGLSAKTPDSSAQRVIDQMTIIGLT